MMNIRIGSGINSWFATTTLTLSTLSVRVYAKKIAIYFVDLPLLQKLLKTVLYIVLQ